MPFAPELEGAPEALEFLTKFLATQPHDVVFWYLEDPDDLGSFRLLFTAHDVGVSAGTHLTPLLGGTMRELFAPLLETEAPAKYREALRTGEPWEMPHLRYEDDKTPDREYRLIAYPVTDRLIALLVEDVTAEVQAERGRRRAMAALEAKTRELERSNQELEAFAYVASHDLRAPLRDIENLATWIEEDAGGAMPAKSVEHLQRLRDRVSRMQRLLSDLLEYSRAGRVPHTVREVNALEVLQNAKALASPPEGFEVVLPGDGPTLHAPKGPLEQVFMNLIGNAIKHRSSPEGRVEVSWQDAGDFIEFAVTDDGPGIPRRFQHRVFRLFTTLRPRDDVEGSGMGLALVKKFVDFGGGTITLESEEGQGCTFRFTWPKIWPQDEEMS